MSRYSVKLKRTGQGFIQEYKVDAADSTAANAAASQMATDGGGNFDSPEVALDVAVGIALTDVYPVGSVYVSALSTSPATLFGFGTWLQIGAGRTLVGQDSGDADFLTAGLTGGEKTHTLTSAEMPSHTHVQDAHTHTQNAHSHVQSVNSASTGGLSGYTADTSTNTSVASGYSTQTTVATNQNTTATNQNTGGGGAHNNMPPYLVVYFWQRTA